MYYLSVGVRNNRGCPKISVVFAFASCERRKNRAMHDHERGCRVVGIGNESGQINIFVVLVLCVGIVFLYVCNR